MRQKVNPEVNTRAARGTDQKSSNSRDSPNSSSSFRGRGPMLSVTYRACVPGLSS